MLPDFFCVCVLDLKSTRRQIEGDLTVQSCVNLTLNLTLKCSAVKTNLFRQVVLQCSLLSQRAFTTGQNAASQDSLDGAPVEGAAYP